VERELSTFLPFGNGNYKGILIYQAFLSSDFFFLKPAHFQDFSYEIALI